MESICLMLDVPDNSPGTHYAFIPPMIIIYQDYVHNTGSLYQTLCDHFGVSHVTYADADAIINGSLSGSVKAFFMPGGATRYVASKLNGKGNDAIRQYVDNGGLYFGICAGAYYACRRTEWHPEQGPSILMDDELGFFQGIAQGPIRQFTDTSLDLDYTAARVSLVTADNEYVTTLYRGGPLFQADHAASYDVLARYDSITEKPAAVITGTMGKGRYILSSPHIEVSSSHLDLMNFDVIANQAADIAAMPSRTGVSIDYFRSLLNRYIG